MSNESINWWAQRVEHNRLKNDVEWPRELMAKPVILTDRDIVRKLETYRGQQPVYIDTPSAFQCVVTGIDVEAGAITVGFVDPLDVEYDGVTLRTLIEHEEFNRRELSGEHYQCWQMSQPQKDAVSAHWSAQLRAKVAEAKAKERNAVTYCEEDEP